MNRLNTDLKRCIRTIAIKADKPPSVIRGSILVRIDRQTCKILSYGKFIRQGGVPYELYIRLRDEKNGGNDWLPPDLIPRDPREIERQLKYEARRNLIVNMNRQITSCRNAVESARSYVSGVPNFLNRILVEHPSYFSSIHLKYINEMMQLAVLLVDTTCIRAVIPLRRDVEDLQRYIADKEDEERIMTELMFDNHSVMVPKSCSKRGRCTTYFD